MQTFQQSGKFYSVLYKQVHRYVGYVHIQRIQIHFDYDSTKDKWRSHVTEFEVTFEGTTHTRTQQQQQQKQKQQQQQRSRQLKKSPSSRRARTHTV